MANYYSTGELLEVIKGQVVKVAGHEVDSVLRFHGNLSQAVEQHFGQPAGHGVQSAIVVSLLPGTPAATASDGTPLYLNEGIEIFVISRAKRGQYDDSSTRLMRIVDMMTWDLFSADNKGPDTRERIAAHRFVGRQPRILNDPNVMAYSVQWEIKPRQTP